MTFRTRILVGTAVVALGPLIALGLVVREHLTARLTAQYERRILAQVRVAQQDLERTDASIAARLEALARTLERDDRLRLVLIRGPAGDREYLLDWAGPAMRLSALDMLQLQDAQGRIVSSGHFRNEFDRLEPAVPALLDTATRAVLVRARAPDGPFLALARGVRLRIAGRSYALIGGVRVDSVFLSRLARDADTQIVLHLPGDSARRVVWASASGVSDRADAARAELPLPIADLGAASPALAPGSLQLALPRAELRGLVRSVERWFFAALLLAGAAVLVLAWWIASRLGQPLAQLTQAVSTLSLEGPGASLPVERDDEVGTLARRFAAVATRLRASATQLRAAERRATVGEMARQVNHDIRNGLIPIRNVVRHLGEVQRDQPAALPHVFAERRPTIESSLDYLEKLARNYARLSPRPAADLVDLNALAREVAASLGDTAAASLTLRLTPGRPAVQGDAVSLRRVLENLVRNALDSMAGRNGGGVVQVRTATDGRLVWLEVTDNGCGMTEAARARAFDDFFTTKPGGTGLGLSVVRRLVLDLGGSVRLTSNPGTGTTVMVELPAAPPRRPADRQPAREGS